MGKKGGLALVEKYGNDYMRDLGKKGFEATVLNHFNGDRAAAAAWLRGRGCLIERRRAWDSYAQEIYLYIKRKR